MLKVRLMGTAKDIRWSERVLRKNSDLKVSEMSELFSNKGTKRFFRAYMEVEKISTKEIE